MPLFPSRLPTRWCSASLAAPICPSTGLCVGCAEGAACCCCASVASPGAPLGSFPPTSIRLSTTQPPPPHTALTCPIRNQTASEAAALWPQREAAASSFPWPAPRSVCPPRCVLAPAARQTPSQRAQSHTRALPRPALSFPGVVARHLPGRAHGRVRRKRTYGARPQLAGLQGPGSQQRGQRAHGQPGRRCAPGAPRSVCSPQASTAFSSPQHRPSTALSAEATPKCTFAFPAPASATRRRSGTTRPVRVCAASCAAQPATRVVCLMAVGRCRPPLTAHLRMTLLLSGVAVVEEAGGTVTDVNGKPLDFSVGRTLKENTGAPRMCLCASSVCPRHASSSHFQSL